MKCLAPHTAKADSQNRRLTVAQLCGGWRWPGCDGPGRRLEPLQPESDSMSGKYDDDTTPDATRKASRHQPRYVTGTPTAPYGYNRATHA
jgi:hypothetical protein